MKIIYLLLSSSSSFTTSFEKLIRKLMEEDRIRRIGPVKGVNWEAPVGEVGIIPPNKKKHHKKG